MLEKDNMYERERGKEREREGKMEKKRGRNT